MSQKKSQKLYQVRLRLPDDPNLPGETVRRDVFVRAADNITAQRRAIKRNRIATGVISIIEVCEATEGLIADVC